MHGKTPPRRFLYLVTDAFGGHGGIALYNRDMLTALSEFPGCKEIVAIPRMMPNAAEPLPANVTYMTDAVGGKWRYMLATLRAILRSRNFDVIVCGHINLLPLAYICSLLTRSRVVLLIYGIDAWKANINPVVNWLLPRVDRVISISNITASRFLSWSKLNTSRLTLHPNAIHTEWYAPGDRSDRLLKRYGLKGKKILMTMGRLVSAERHKGFDEVLEILPRLIRRDANLMYLVVGGGNDKKRLEEKAIALGIRDHVVFTDLIPEKEKSDYFRLADVYVMPSRGEGFGFVFLEAMACGIPVIGSRLDGSREALRDGELGDLVDPANSDELENAIVEGLRRQRGVVPTGLHYFSYKNFKARTLTLFGEVIGTKTSHMVL